MTDSLKGIRVRVIPMGCRTNIFESEALCSEFAAAGSILADEGPLDAAVLVSCSVTAEADRKCRQAIRKFRNISPGAVIAVTGCYAQLRPEEISSIPGVDLIIGMKPKKLCTGHLAEVVTDKIEKRLTEYRDRIYAREKRIINFLKKGPATIDTLAERKMIYGLHPNTFVLFWEKSMLKKHLDRLIEHGRVEKTDDNRYAVV